MTQVLDPVCGMTIAAEQAADHYEYASKTYYFCNPGCGKRFRADPERYLHHSADPVSPDTVHSHPQPASKEHPRPDSPGKATEYTCPMHPEVVSDRPGSCPKCGMALTQFDWVKTRPIRFRVAIFIGHLFHTDLAASPSVFGSLLSFRP